MNACSYLFKLTVILGYFLVTNLSATVKLPKLISDGMILQRNTPVKIWGWAEKKEKITIKFINSTYTASADENGKWSVIVSKHKAGGPFEMVVTASNIITIRNIMIGDVWVCSGQSNMEFSMRDVANIYKNEIKNSTNDHIRQFSVPRKYNFNTALEDVETGSWKSANPENILRFSAAAYFFAKELYSKYKVPIGLINTSLGGSPAEAWISEESIKQFPSYYEEAQKFKDSSVIKNIEKSDRERISEWNSLLKQKDEGYKDPQNLWNNPASNTSDWETMKIPGYWADAKPGNVNGVVWFKRKINVPASIAGKPSLLVLGRIVDADSVFINGTFVGTTGSQYPRRKYNISPSVLREGENIIIVRVVNNSGKGGFVPGKLYKIYSESDSLDLSGEWQYRIGASMEPLAGQTFVMWKPVGLFNAMISPLLNYKITGVIWYQGESNTGRALEYRTLLPALINDWRKNWNQGDFPFLIVQLPNFNEEKDQPYESEWALFRESQLKTLSVINTGLAVTIDIGEGSDIHPLNKKDVGCRLALTAEKVAYGEKKVVYSGPIYKSMKVNKNNIILTFSNVGSGLIAKNGNLKYFAIAGADKKFVWADAKIENNKVVVWNENINKPGAVRYAWADNPEGANLYNKEGLPASPFRTDSWNEVKN